MSDDLVLYTHPRSRGRVARWMLEEVGQPYRVDLLDYATTMKAPAYLAINPMGKVPAIVHRGVVVTESAAICAYLADTFPDAGLAPAPGSPDRAAYYRWLFFAAGPLEAAVTDRLLGVEVPAARQGAVGYGSYAQVIDALDQALAGRAFLAGDRFSAADLYVAAFLGSMLRFGAIDPRPAFADFAGRMAERPAARRAQAADDALLAPASDDAASATP